MPVYQEVVADDIDYVGDRSGDHRRPDAVDASQGRAERKAQRLKERKRTGYAQIGRSFRHKLFAKPHHPQNRLCIEAKERAHAEAEGIRLHKRPGR